MHVSVLLVAYRFGDCTRSGGHFRALLVGADADEHAPPYGVACRPRWSTVWPRGGNRMSQKFTNKGDGNQIAQFGGDLNGTLNQINGTRTLASLTLPELGAVS